MSNPLISPILITGCRRSGTTLLRTMLAGHPDLLVHPDEPQFFLELYQRFGTQIPDIKLAIQHVAQHPYRADNVTPEKLTEAFKKENTLPLRDFSQKYLALWGGSALETRRPVIKHPALIFYLDLVFDLFPNVTIIHLVRDPRANISSQRARWQRATLWDCIGWWQDAARLGHVQAKIQPKRCVEITYEALVKEPETSLKTICKFLNIAYSAHLLNFKLHTTSFTQGKAKAETFTHLDPSRLNLWKKSLTPLEVAVIEETCKDEMTWWGYTPTYPNVPRPLRAGRTFLERITYALITTVRRMKGTNWRG